jgi:competence protein ComGF
MKKIDKFLFGLLILFVLTIIFFGKKADAKINVEVDGKDCVVEEIHYSEIYSYIIAKGNCTVIYNICKESFCEVKEIIKKDDYLRGNYGAVN